MSAARRRHKSTSAAVYAFFGGLLVLLFVVFGTGVFLRVNEIEITGNSVYTGDEILEASGITTGKNLLFINKNSISRKIYASMPLISKIEIKKNIPDKVIINVSETKGIAVIEYRDSNVLIDSSCKVLGEADNSSNGMILVRGFTPSGANVGSELTVDSSDNRKLSSLKDVLNELEKAGIEKDVSFINVTNIANISFKYQKRFSVILGVADNIQNKLSGLPGIIRDIESRAPRDEQWVINLSDRQELWRWFPEQ